MKTLKFIRATTLVSDFNTDDPITQTGNQNIKCFTQTTIPDDFFLYFIKLGDKHCTRFGYGGAFNLEHGVLEGAPGEILNRVTQGTAKIVLSWPLESFMEDSIFTEIHEYFKHHAISLTSVIYLNCCPNGNIIYNSFCKRHNIDSNRITTEYIPWYMYDRTNHTNPYTIGKRKKVFFALNRRMHDHRCLLVTLMDKENLLDASYVSFPKYHVGTNETFLEKAAGYLPGFNRYGITVDDVKHTDEKLPLVLDIDNWNPYPLPITSNRLTKFYENSLISIVAETFFYSSVIHLTEKSFKPIINHHPFIVVSAPHTLKAIRSFGFKTFGNIIDESYDSIENHQERFDAILSIIRDVSTWSTKKKVQATENLKEIVDYNYDLIHSRPLEELNSFIEKYGV
jgi:hypothetical protein